MYERRTRRIPLASFPRKKSKENGRRRSVNRPVFFFDRVPTREREWGWGFVVVCEWTALKMGRGREDQDSSCPARPLQIRIARSHSGLGAGWRGTVCPAPSPMGSVQWHRGRPQGGSIGGPPSVAGASERCLLDVGQVLFITLQTGLAGQPLTPRGTLWLPFRRVSPSLPVNLVSGDASRHFELASGLVGS